MMMALLMKGGIRDRRRRRPLARVVCVKRRAMRAARGARRHRVLSAPPLPVKWRGENEALQPFRNVEKKAALR